MAKVMVDISMSLDGFIAGPNADIERPLGEGGDGLHQWVYELASFRERHGLTGGKTGRDNEVLEEVLETVGAVLMGRRMFSGGEGPWGDDPNADGWWGDTPPFGVPVFILTHHPRETVIKQGGTTFNFVTDGIESALDEARAAAGDKDVSIAGGANTVQQYIRAGHVDEMQIHLVPVLLGDGIRLLEHVGTPQSELESTRVLESPDVTHLRFRLA